jgi:hypothetical protein
VSKRPTFCLEKAASAAEVWDPVTDRRWIVEKLGAASFDRMARELSGSELQSVLLELMHARARARSPARVLEQFERDGFCRPAPVDQRALVDIDRELLLAAKAFEAIELSPLASCAARSSSPCALPAMSGSVSLKHHVYALAEGRSGCWCDVAV